MVIQVRLPQDLGADKQAAEDEERTDAHDDTNGQNDARTFVLVRERAGERSI